MANTTVEKVADVGYYVSIRVTLTDDGGAHLNVTRQHYLVDTRDPGRAVLPFAIFAYFTDARDIIDGLCVRDLRRQAEQDDIELFPDLEDKVSRILARSANYCFREKELAINFDAYSVAAYACGPREVVVPYEETQDLLTAEFKQIVLP